MAEIKIAGVMRAGIYSPNHIGNDAAIFNMVVDQLRKRGCLVKVYNEEQLKAGEVTEDIIINMCREPESLARLQQAEDSGALVVNSAYGIENCIRQRMARILAGNNIPYPQTLIVNTDENVIVSLNRAGIDRCWIKRGDRFAMHKEDVTFVRHAEEAQEILHEYFMRGIERAVINRHCEGRLIKFYGIRGNSFFYSFDPLKAAGAAINTIADDTLSSQNERLHSYCERAAEVLDIRIYGGDCIIDSQGQLTIIDFKDWPSFAPCRNQAAPYIAREILSLAKSHVHKS